GVRRGAADPALLELADEARLRPACRRLCLMPPRLEAAGVELLPDAERGQHALLVLELVVRVVGALDVGAEEAREGDHLAGGLERRCAVGAGVRVQAHLRPQARSVPHLGGYRALPDEVVEAQRVRVQVTPQA